MCDTETIANPGGPRYAFHRRRRAQNANAATCTAPEAEGKAMIRSAVGLALAACLAACSPSAETPKNPASGTASAVPYKTDLSMKELMAHVVDHAADGIWLAQGWLINAEGTHELFPTTDDGWRYASNAAVTLAEVSNLLLLPGRPLDDDKRWTEATHHLYEAAMQAHETAETRDKEAFFKAGSAIYEACTECHSHYVVGSN